MTTAGTDTPHWVKNTQETLGAIIRSPKLAEKLLLKPPVKFVHDILTSFLKATGFPEGLYSAGELDSSNLKDRESKLRFIQKLIDVVASALDREVTCRAAKVISGSEPEKTNELLQWLVECHTLPKEKQINAVTEVLRRDTDGAIAAVTARMGAPSGSGDRPDPPSLSTQGSEIPVPITESTPSAGMSGGPESLSGSLSPKLKESNLNTLDAADIKLETHSSPPSISERPNSSAVRLRTQQPRPSEPRAGKDTGKSSSLAESNPSIASDTYAEGEESTGPMEGKESAVDRAYRLLSRKGSTTSGTVSASGGGEEAINKGTGHGEGEPQGYFAREALQERESGEGRTGDDRNDTAGLRTGSAAGGEPRRKENGIILRTSEKKRVVGSKGTGLDNNNSDASGSQGSNHRSGLGSSGQIARGNATASEPTAGNSAPDRAQELQEKLRVLSKATHPIGVVVENNAADIEAILRELTQWKTEYRVQAQRLIEVRREHEEQLRPLEIQLKDLRATTLEQEHMVNSMRAVVCANERAIEQLIHMMTGTGE